MSTPPSNFYMMIRWHSCLLYTLYPHQHVISHFLGMFHFYPTPPSPSFPPLNDDWKTNPQISVGALWKMKSKGFHFFVCRKGPNYVGYFEVEIQPPVRKPAILRGWRKKGASLCRRSSHSPSKLLVYTAQNFILQGFFWSLNDNRAFHS